MGPRGVTLSGGQQARVSLARALYSSSPILLLDDILSALDADTAQHVFRALTGPIVQGRTVVLVTHNLPLTLGPAAYVVALRDGTVAGQGTAQELMDQGVLTDEMLIWTEQDAQREITLVEETEEKQGGAVEEEDGALQGGASLEAYKLYFLSMSRRRLVRLALWSTVVVMAVAVRASDVAANAWLKRWASSSGSGKDTSSYFLKMFLTLSLSRIILDVISIRSSLQGGLNAARGVYARVLNSLLAAPCSFFDKNPVGRIINILSHDVDTVHGLGFQFDWGLFAIFDALAPVVVVLFQIPGFIGPLLILAACCSGIIRLHFFVFRNLRRLEVAARSPLYTIMSDILSGLITIRASGSTKMWFAQVLGVIDSGNRTNLFQYQVYSWLEVSLALTASTLLLLLGMFFVFNPSVDAALAGFLLSISIGLESRLLNLVRVATAVGVEMTSVERQAALIQLQPERYGGIVTPPAAWPAPSGALEVQELSVRYASSSPYALDTVSVTIPAGRKTALCGLSGSGKSTLALSFLRAVEPDAGRVTLDGLDIATVPLNVLRERIAYVPQHADLFAGTVRSNLDPLGRYEDSLLWQILAKCHLAHSSSTSGPPSQESQRGFDGMANCHLITTLDMPINTGGTNLSHGQRQLLNLARGMVKLTHTHWLLLDEATAALDSETDRAIQTSIDEVTALYGATVVAIAHRLQGIVTWDHVIVLDQGRVIEQGDPYTLLTQSDGAFCHLAKRSGNFEGLLARAKNAANKRAGSTLEV